MPSERNTWAARYSRWRLRRRVKKALALNRRGEVRADALVPTHLENRLTIDWCARDVHPWDRDLRPDDIARLFAQQCLEDVSAAIDRLFLELPEIDLVDFRVSESDSLSSILYGSVTRSAAEAVEAKSVVMKLKQLGVTFRLVNRNLEHLG